MRGIVGFDLLRLDGYLAMETEELDGKLYVDTIITDPVVEQCGGRGYDLETLRAKALLKYGTKRLIDIYDFSIRLNDPDYDKIMNTTIGHGVNLSTLECDLRAGLFD